MNTALYHPTKHFPHITHYTCTPVLVLYVEIPAQTARISARTAWGHLTDSWLEEPEKTVPLKCLHDTNGDPLKPEQLNELVEYWNSINNAPEWSAEEILKREG